MSEEGKTTKAKLSKAEIRAIMDGTSTVDPKTEFEEGREAALAAEAEKARQTPAPAVQPKQAATPAVEATTEKPASESPSEQPTPAGNPDSTRLDLLEKELALRALEMEKLRQENKKWMYRAQTREGELNFLKTSESDDRGSHSPARESGRFGWEQSPASAGSSDEMTERLQSLEGEAVERAKEREVLKFHTEFPDFNQDDEFASVLRDLAPDYEFELRSGSPKKVGRSTAMLLREAKLEVDRRRAERAVQEARDHMASLHSEARQRKLDSMVSDSTDTSASSASPPKQYASERERLMDMPQEELAALLNAQRSRR